MIGERKYWMLMLVMVLVVYVNFFCFINEIRFGALNWSLCTIIIQHSKAISSKGVG